MNGSHEKDFSQRALQCAYKSTSFRRQCVLVTCVHYRIRCDLVRSCKGSKQRNLCLELYDRSEIWRAHRQQCCQCACQMSKRCDNSKAMQLWDYMRSYDKTSYLILKRVPGKGTMDHAGDVAVSNLIQHVYRGFNYHIRKGWTRMLGRQSISCIIFHADDPSSLSPNFMVL